MSALITEIVIILLLLTANGLFAMTEISVVAARRRCQWWKLRSGYWLK